MATKPGTRKPTVSAAKRRKIIEMAKSGQYGRNAIVREVGVAAGTVTKIVAEAGLSFDRAATRVAVQARKDDCRAKRTEMALLLIEDAKRLRAQMWQPCTLHSFGGKDNTHASIDLAEPIFADKLKLMQATASALGRHLDIEKHDADQRAAGVAGMLNELGRALGVQQPEQ